MLSVKFAAYEPRAKVYRFDEHVCSFPITNAPGDTNFRRWSMLHDGTAYRMYVFCGSTSDQLYEFIWNGNSYDYSSTSTIRLRNIPYDADASSFCMLHNGSEFLLYLRRLGDPTLLYQFVRQKDGEAHQIYQWGVEGAYSTLQIACFPSDTDWGRWMMLHDNQSYRLYAFQLGSNTHFYQGVWNGEKYMYGQDSVPPHTPMLTLEGTPTNSNLASAAMLHDGSQYRLYMQTL